ncbi:hypothetical protein ACD661_15325 [Legionella lytica]|uniref:Uncharacterized protein n=1 Tax=Legionella lytica TaxID=96232 RepID=A0ABW8DB43_9GAMM
MFHHIEKLISVGGYGLRSWSYPFEEEVWLGLTSISCQLDVVEKIISNRDCDYIEYLENQWVPIVYGNNFADALSKLDRKLSNLSSQDLGEDSIWFQAINDIYHHIDSAYHGFAQLADKKFPYTYEELRESHQTLVE